MTRLLTLLTANMRAFAVCISLEYRRRNSGARERWVCSQVTYQYHFFLKVLYVGRIPCQGWNPIPVSLFAGNLLFANGTCKIVICTISELFELKLSLPNQQVLTYEDPA